MVTVVLAAGRVALVVGHVAGNAHRSGRRAGRGELPPWCPVPVTVPAVAV